MERNESVIVTGGQGFIGSWVARLLLHEKRYNIVIVDVKPDDHILKQILSDQEIKQMEFVYLDIANTQAVNELVQRVRPSFIIHLAGLQIPTCKANPILGAQVNVIGTINVFEAVRQLQVAKQQSACCPIIYASSAAVSGPSEDYEGGPVSDDAHHQPLTNYGVYKQANEGTARVYWLDHKIPSVALRPFTVYGVGREIGVTSAPTKALKATLLGLDYTIPFSGELCVNYVEDIARLFIQLGQSNKIQGSFTCNIKGDVIDVKEWVDIVKSLSLSKNNIKIEGSKLPYPIHFKEDTLVKLLGVNQVETTPPRIGIQTTLSIFRELNEKGQLEKRDLQ